MLHVLDRGSSVYTRCPRALIASTRSPHGVNARPGGIGGYGDMRTVGQRGQGGRAIAGHGGVA